MDPLDELTEAGLPQTEDTSNEELEEDITPAEDTVQEESQGEPNDDDDDDGLEAAIAAKAEQIANQKLQDALAEERRKQEEAALQYQKSQEEEARKKKLTDSLADTAKKTAEKLKALKVYNEDGEQLAITDDFIQEIVQPWREHNGFVQEAIMDGATTEVYTDLARAAISIVPEEKRQEFATKAGGKPLPDYLKTLVEVNAPNTDFVRRLTEEKEVAEKAAYARGFAKGRKAPLGSPENPSQTPVVRGDKPDLTTLSGAARALANGQIDEIKFNELRKQIRGL